MRVVLRHLFLLPICGGSTQVQFGCEQTSRRSQTRIVCLSRERGELESGATVALRQGAVVGTGLVRRLGQMDEQERGECALLAALANPPCFAHARSANLRWTPLSSLARVLITWCDSVCVR